MADNTVNDLKSFLEELMASQSSASTEKQEETNIHGLSKENLEHGQNELKKSEPKKQAEPKPEVKQEPNPEPKKPEPKEVKARSYMTHAEIMEYAYLNNINDSNVDSICGEKAEYKSYEEKRFVATYRKYIQEGDTTIFNLLNRVKENIWLQNKVSWSNNEKFTGGSLEKLAGRLNATRQHTTSYMEDGEEVVCSHLHKGLRDCFLHNKLPDIVAVGNHTNNLLTPDTMEDRMIKAKYTDAGFNFKHESIDTLILAVIKDCSKINYNEGEHKFIFCVDEIQETSQPVRTNAKGNVVSSLQLIKKLVECGIKSISEVHELRESKNLTQDEADISATCIHLMETDRSLLNNIFGFIGSSWYIKNGFIDGEEFIGLGKSIDKFIKQVNKDAYDYQMYPEGGKQRGNIAEAFLADIWLFESSAPFTANNHVVRHDTDETLNEYMEAYKQIVPLINNSYKNMLLQGSGKDLGIALGALISTHCNLRHEVYVRNTIVTDGYLKEHPSYLVAQKSSQPDSTVQADVSTGSNIVSQENQSPAISNMGTGILVQPDNTGYSNNTVNSFPEEDYDKNMKEYDAQLKSLTDKMAQDPYFANSKEFRMLQKINKSLDRKRALTTKDNLTFGDKIHNLKSALKAFITPSGYSATVAKDPLAIEMKDFDKGETKEEMKKAYKNFRKEFSDELLKTFRTATGDLDRLTSLAISGDTLLINGKVYPVEIKNEASVPSELLEAVKQKNYAVVFDFAYLKKLPKLKIFECDSEQVFLSIVMADLGYYKIEPVAMFTVCKGLWELTVGSNHFDRLHVKEQFKESNFYKPNIVCTYVDRIGNAHQNLTSGSWNLTKSLWNDGKYVRGTFVGLWTGINKLLHIGGEVGNSAVRSAGNAVRHKVKKGTLMTR